MRTTTFALMLASMTLAPSALAIQPDSGGWYHTGDAVRQKTVVFVTANVYSISHDMKCVVPRNKQAVIDADCDKRFIWRMMRDVGNGKIVDAMKEAYAKNGYNDAGKINQALGAFSAEFKENAYVKINYDSAAKTTTFWEQNGGSTTVAGIDFMKATWKIWLGNIDPPSIGDRLIANL
jgi:predicted butyrate kinase (DUF1464 family)